jgi:hypothetical protein
MERRANRLSIANDDAPHRRLLLDQLVEGADERVSTSVAWARIERIVALLPSSPLADPKAGS